MIKNIKKIKHNREDYTLLKKKLKELGSTFCSKLLIKLTSKIFIPDLYLQILKYEYNNRTNDDIAKTLPRFQKMESLNEYTKYNEDNKNNNSSNIILELAWISFYQYKKKLSFIKKANENKNFFYLILNGKITKLNLTFKKEKISIEEYLLYMLKMKLIQEKQILNKCNKLNKAYISLDINNLKTFFNQNKDYNFRELKQRAKRELVDSGFIFEHNNNVIIPSIEAYLKLSFFQTAERNDTQTRFHLFIGHYVVINTLNKGNYIGDLSKNENNEGYTYICNTKCDICYVNKIESKNSKLYKLIFDKYLKIFQKIKNKFFIFKDTSDDICLKNILPIMTYKKFKKGEKIIIQNSQYEGIYFMIDGEVKISISQTFNELSDTLVSLQYSIFNFKDYVSKIIKTIDIIKEFNYRYMIKQQKNNIIDIGNTKINNGIFSSNEYLNYFNITKYLEFYTLKEGDIVGLNELFDYKSELYNFTAECISNEVNLFFISKDDFNNIMEKESSIMNNVIQLIDLKAKSLIGKINNFRFEYRNAVINNLKSKNYKSVLFNNLLESTKNINIKNKIYEVSKDEINKNSKETDTNFWTKNKTFMINNKKDKKGRNEIIHINKIKLFKNNELLNYLKNKELVRNNSIKDSLNIQNINKNLLSPRYIYKPKTSNIVRTNSTINNFRKKTVLLKNNILTPKHNINTNYMNYMKKINADNKGNTIKNNNISNNHINLSNNNKYSNKIIFNEQINPIGNGEALLFNIMNNQKKFDEIQNEYENNESLPSIKSPIRKKDNFRYKMGKTDSFKNFSKHKFKIYNMKI